MEPCYPYECMNSLDELPERFGASRRSLQFRELPPQHLHVTLGLHLQTIPSLISLLGLRYERQVIISSEESRELSRSGLGRKALVYIWRKDGCEPPAAFKRGNRTKAGVRNTTNHGAFIVAFCSPPLWWRERRVISATGACW